jgi:hypothetical protein
MDWTGGALSFPAVTEPGDSGAVIGFLEKSFSREIPFNGEQAENRKKTGKHKKSNRKECMATPPAFFSKSFL